MTFTLSSPPDTNFLKAFPSLEALKTSVNQSINKSIKISAIQPTSLSLSHHLTLYTLTSVSKFSVLYSVHFL